MPRRTTLIALTALLVLVGAAPAAAQQRTLTFTLQGGATVTTTMDVPAGADVSQLTPPGVTEPVVSVKDHGAVATPTPSATPAKPDPTPTPTPKREKQNPKPTTTPGPNGSPNGAQGQRGGGQERAGEGNKAQGRSRARETERDKERAKAEPKDTDAGAQTPAAPAQPAQPAQPAPAQPAPTGPSALPEGAVGVPNFFIDRFRIPPFLLPIYQAAGIQYGIRWEILAAINEIETDYGRNLSVSSAGALGWMQFMPSSWEAYGVDANGDGVKDPYNPVDAIFAAARYLRAAGAEQDLSRAIFAYNHAQWYVDDVLLRARVIGGLPANLVGSLTGLTQGRFPVYARSTYAGDVSERAARRRVAQGENAAYVVESEDARRAVEVFARRNAPVVAVNDGRVVKIGRSARRGRFVELQDVYGNTYTYSRLGKVAESYPAPKPRQVTPERVARELELPKPDARPDRAASDAGRRGARRSARSARAPARAAAPADPVAAATPTPAPSGTKERLFANPERPKARRAGGDQQLSGGSTAARPVGSTPYLTRIFGADRTDLELKRLRKGSRVAAGTILGRLAAAEPAAGAAPAKAGAASMRFEIRPAGRGAPRVDPKPILDGWKLLESTAVYRAEGKSAFSGPGGADPSIGQILLMGQEALIERVLANPRIEIYECGRRDIRTGQVDRRVLATLEFLAASGLRPSVSSLKCGHGYYTSSGNVSAHSSGDAVDIAAVNGTSILGHQGKGSITEESVRRLLTLQGTMKPHQIITLTKFAGAENTLAMSDHDDHIHVGWRSAYGGDAKTAQQVNAILKPGQWTKLIERLDAIDNPVVRRSPSRYALRAGGRSGRGG